MDRRDRDRYDRDNYDRDYSGGAGYNRGDEHYHSARNLTNEFEQHYRRDHRDEWSDDRSRNRDEYRPHRSYHEGDMGGAYEQRSRGDRNQNQGYSSNYGSSSDRYNRYQDDFRREQDRYNRDRNRGQERRGGMSQDRMREGYGISDYGRMRQSSVSSNRGIPNPGITSSYSDDYGSTDFDRDRSYGISSGSYGAYGSHSGEFRRNRDDW